MIYIGIDPGSVSGGMAWVYNSSCECLRFKDLTDKELCLKIKSLKSYPGRSVCVIIESVHVFPGQGVVSSSKLVGNFYMLKGMLMALDIPFKEVSPQKWMSYYNMKKDKSETRTQWKRRLRQKAQEIYPNVSIVNETADAILIAEYCKNNY